MGVYRNFPYSNFHEMNMDEILKILKTMSEEWDETKTEWTSYKDYIDNYFANLNLNDEVLNAIRVLANDGTLHNIIAPDIAGYVTTWLNENVTTTTPVIDNTLLISGAAADAQVAGNDIRALFNANTIDSASRFMHNNKEQAGISFTWNADGSCHVSGTSSATAFCNMYANQNELPDKWKTGQRIRIKYESNAVGLHVFMYDSGGNVTRNFTTYHDVNLTLSDLNVGMILRLEVPTANTVVNETVHPHIFIGYTDDELNTELSTTRDCKDDIEIICNYDVLQGYQGGSGNILSNGYRTSLLKVTPGARYYSMIALSSLDIFGCFFDKEGTYLRNILRADHEYDSDGFVAFDIPDDAYYMNLNIVTKREAVSLCSKKCLFPGYAGKWSVDNASIPESTKDKIRVPDIGNIVIPAGDRTLNNKKNKKLCCIGDSITFIDRGFQDNINLGNLLAGWQEYIGVFYDSYKNYGFSGGAWGPYSGAEYQNIYDGIVTAGVDLSDYDDFILYAGFNLMGESAYPMGTLGDYNTNDPDINTMLGAMRGVINYIYAQNPKAKIYLMTNQHTNGYYNYSATRTRLPFYRSEIFRIAPLIGAQVIDIETEAGFTAANLNKLTYDGLHPNNEGMYNIGQAVVHNIIK